jgi:peptide deformylase
MKNISRIEYVAGIDKIVTNISKLRQKSVETTMQEVERMHLIDRLRKANSNAWTDGAGLAAIQIGVPLRFAWYRYNNKDGILLNPKIIKGHGESVMEEGCLSIPNRYTSVKRFVTIEYESNGKKKTANGFLARIVQHECLSRRTEIFTEDGTLSAKFIYDTKYSGKVLSVSSNGHCEWKSIVSFFKIPNKCKKWVSVFIGRNKNRLYCTSDHKCACVDNILFPVIRYIEAKDMKNKYCIICPDVARRKNKRHPLYNAEQISVMVGSLLGDACVDSKGVFIATHGKHHKNYAKYRTSILRGVLKRGYSGYRDKNCNYLCVGKVNEQTKYLREITYINKLKTVRNIINLINSTALAFWYMDDGCFLPKGACQLHTEGFLYEDVVMLRDMFITKFKCFPSIYKRKVHDKNRYYLFFPKDQTKLLHALISPYIHEEYRYKLLPEYRKTPFVEVNSDFLQYSAGKVRRVTVLKNLESALYDFTVEDNHNLFADDMLVHNCDHMDGILNIDRKV